MKLFILLFFLILNVQANNCNTSAKPFLVSEQSVDYFLSQKLVLKSKDGKVTELDSHNYYLDHEDRPREFIQNFVTTFFERGIETNKRIFERITQVHAQFGATFRVKDNATGRYDKIFKVPFRGYAPIAKKQFDEITNSTKPFMKAMRAILQNVYSTKTFTASSVGIDHIPLEAQNIILGILNNSIYLEPKVINEVMKDYPFVPIAGFDAAVGNLDNTKPVFYEVNGSTPSGWSNQAQLLEIFKKEDPTLYETIKGQLAAQSQIHPLRVIIDSCAKKWTGESDSISVIIGPGVYNAAQPDVSVLAEMTGMPLVKMEDLYIDSAGFVRLNTGKSNHPKVTGIYSRMDEAWLLQSNQKGIPLRSPHYNNNVELGKKFGVELENGIIYKFQYDSKGEIVGVDLDESGQPLFEESAIGQLGVDPNKANASRGNLVDSLHAKKVYISNIGGRTLDDKRAFQIISEYLASAFSDGGPIAGPTRTLKLNEYNEFYTSEQLEKYVVKAPDMSGGEGIYLMVNLSEDARAQVIQLVKENPSSYTIQEFAEQAALPTPVLRDGQLTYVNVANDWRIYSGLDGDGNLIVDNQSILVRVAEFESSSTNTSQGAGYGLGLVVDSARSRSQFYPTGTRNPLRASTRHGHVGATRIQDLENYLKQILLLENLASPTSTVSIFPSTIDSTVLLHMDVMDLLGREFSPFLDILQKFKAKEITKDEFYQSLLNLKNQLQTQQLSVDGLSTVVSRVFTTEDLNLEKRPIAELHDYFNEQDQTRVVTIKVNEGSKETSDFVHKNTIYKKIEWAQITSSTEPFIQNVIDELKKYGGELRQLNTMTEDGKSLVVDQIESSYFKVDDLGRPIIAININNPDALPILAHEFRGHFYDWLAIYLREKRRFPSANDRTLRIKARDLSLETFERVESEKRSLAYERAQREIRSRNFTNQPINTNEFDPIYISQNLYPQIEGVRDILHGVRWQGKALDKTKLVKLLKEIINEAKKMKEKSLDYWEGQLESGQNKDLAKENLTMLKNMELFELIFSSHELDRFRSDQTYQALNDIYLHVQGGNRGLPVIHLQQQ